MKTFIIIFSTLVFPDCLIAQLDDEFHGRQNATINFYGKVADQEGRPLPGANVQVERVFGEWATPPSIQLKTERITVQSDGQGSFIVKGITGHSLQILSIEKPGYELSKKAELFFGYSATAARFQPDPSNPVVFNMWKRTAKERLASSAWHGKVACDGTTTRFDLLHGSPSSDGDLEIKCQRAPVTLQPGAFRPFDYLLQVTLVGGGIQTVTNEFTYMAPEGSYSSKVTFEQRADDLKWNGKLPTEFYIKTADGHYGVLTVEWGDGFAKPPLPLKWDCTINPSGSRNLER